MRSIFSNASLIEWLEKQPAGHYRYFCPSGCLLAQYFNHMGLQDPMLSGTTVTVGRKEMPLPPRWDMVAAGHPHSYAGAAQRARKLLSVA